VNGRWSRVQLSKPPSQAGRDGERGAEEDVVMLVVVVVVVVMVMVGEVAAILIFAQDLATEWLPREYFSLVINEQV
jgi:hypothetical protein